jgi:hypothetical protein
MKNKKKKKKSENIPAWMVLAALNASSNLFLFIILRFFYKNKKKIHASFIEYQFFLKVISHFYNQIFQDLVYPLAYF